MQNIRKILLENSDRKFRDFSSTIMGESSYELLGVRIPFLRKLAKELVREYDLEALDLLSDDSFEEILLQGFVIACSRKDLSGKKELINEYLDKADSWGLVDSFVSSFKLKDRELMFSWLEDFLQSEQTFKIRFAYVMMLKYLDDQHIEEIIKYVLMIRSDEYYVEMAQAWLLASCAVDYPELIEQILRSNELNPFTHNRTIQKMIESYRIDKNLKERLRLMKR